MRFQRVIQWLALALTILTSAGCSPDAPSPPARARSVVVGFDGLDPALLKRWIDEGRMPAFAALANEGHFQPLQSSNPPQSPVAWASFATGTNPGEHGIFDFLRRAPGSYGIDFSIAEQTPPKVLSLPFGYQLPLGEGELRNRRDGVPFWIEAEQASQRATVLRVPVTYPADPVSHMLGGMGVPDLLGTQGTYTILATRRIPGADNGGRVVLAPIGEDGIVHASLEGPPHPLRSDGAALSIPMQLRASGNGATLTLGRVSTELQVGQWSGWLRVRFSLGILGSLPGMVRVHLNEGFPRPLLYISPLQVDPRDAALPISSPPSYADELAQRIGDYHTLGMPEETWALNQGHLSESAWLEMVKTTLHEGEAMLYDALDRRDSELVVNVFVQTDRVSHMFWHGLDESHPLHAKSSETARNAIPWIYGEADRILGEVRSRLGPDDRLIVLSDHGFASFHRAVHLNRWLVDSGYMVLKPGADANLPLFGAVDWAKTRAYALGLNGLSINQQGREPEGIVAAKDVDALKREIGKALTGLPDPVNAHPMIRSVFDAGTIYHGAHHGEAPDLIVGYHAGYRASWQTSLGSIPATLAEDNRQHWSGDHCIDPELVPGILLTSFPIDAPLPGIDAIGRLVLDPPDTTSHRSP